MADIDGLKAAFEHVLAAMNRRDLEAFLACHHDQVVILPALSPVPVVGKAAVRQRTAALFANATSVTLTPLNPQFRIIGTTGVVWGHYALAVKPKDSPLRNIFGRLAFTFTQVEGQWLIAASAHLTAPVRKVGGKGTRRQAASSVSAPLLRGPEVAKLSPRAK